MSNKKTAYSCQNCGAIHFKWSGKCSECGSWNSLVEEFAEGGASHFSRLEDDKTSKKSTNNSRKVNLVSMNGEAMEFQLTSPLLHLTNLVELEFREI